MRLAKISPLAAGLALALATASVAGAATGPAAAQASDQQKNLGPWAIPIYATFQDGKPATGLTAADLEFLVSGSPVEGFALTKGATPNKLVFLIFDTASISPNLLSKSKRVAESTVSLSADGVRFIVMTIDPLAGLRAIFGPSTDKATLKKTIAKSVVAKQSDYFRSRSEAGTEIRDAYPQWANRPPALPAQQERNYDFQQDRQVAASLISSLRTLTDLLARFPGSEKIIHLHSAGIASAAVSNRPMTVYNAGGDTAPSENVEVSSPDSVLFDQIATAGRSLKAAGALIILVNPAGTRVRHDSSSSGEPSLLMLARESGGLYFKGSDKEISQALATAEQGYYELTFPPLREMPDDQVPVQVRAKDPNIRLTTVSRVDRARRFARMTPEERQAVIISLLTDGLVGDIDLKVGRTDVGIQGSDGQVLITAQLPFELSQAEWDIYKVWRDRAKGGVTVERDHVLSSGPLLSFTMAVRENEVQDAVLVHARSGTVLVCRTPAPSKS